MLPAGSSTPYISVTNRDSMPRRYSAWLTRRDRLRRVVAGRRLRREDPLHHRAEQRRGRALARHVAEREAERAVGHVDVVVEIAADRPARQRRRRGAEVAARTRRLREQRLLDLRGDPHLLLHPRLLHGLAVEPGVLDRDRGLGRQRLERGARRVPTAATLSRGCRDTARRCAAPRRRSRPCRRSAPGAAARTGRGGCRAPRCPCARWPGRRRAGRRRCAVRRCGRPLRESCGWSRSCCPDSVDAAAAARHLELELAARARQHDEAALGAADVDRRIQHQRQHVVQHAAGSERAQPFEQRGDLPQIADRGGRRPVDRRRRVGEEEHHLGAAAAAEADPVAVRQHPLGHRSPLTNVP